MPNFPRYAGPIARRPRLRPEATATRSPGSRGSRASPTTRSMTGREITSVKDLWDPAFKGKVGMMSDDTELGAVGMLALGIDPTNVDAGRLAARRRPADQAARRRASSASTTTRATSRRSRTATRGSRQAWSGDIFQANYSGYPNLKFVIPKEGGMLWHDNCMIPLHAAAPGRRAGVDQLLLPAAGRGDDRGLGQLRLPGARPPSR